MEIFKDIYNKRLDKIEELNNKIDYNNLKYVVEKSGVKKDSVEYDFNKIKDPVTFLNDVEKGKLSIQEAKYKR